MSKEQKSSHLEWPDHTDSRHCTTEKGKHTSKEAVSWNILFRASLVAQLVKSLPTMQKTPVRFLGWKDTLEKEWQPIPVFMPEKFHGQRSLASYSPQGRKESDMTEQLLLSRAMNYKLNRKRRELCKYKRWSWRVGGQIMGGLAHLTIIIKRPHINSLGFSILCPFDIKPTSSSHPRHYIPTWRLICPLCLKDAEKKSDRKK